MTTSRLERVQAELITYYETISKANGFRSDVKRFIKQQIDPETWQEWPIVQVILGDDNIRSIDTAMSVFEQEVNVYINGFVNIGKEQSDATDLGIDIANGLLHDIQRVTLDFLKTNVNSASNPWYVKNRNLSIHSIRPVYVGESILFVGVEFPITIRILDKSLND